MDEQKDIHKLIKNLQSDDLYVQEVAAKSLEKIGFDKIPEMKDKVFALLILEQTVEIIEIGEPAVPYLIDALKDDDWGMRKYATWALGDIAEEYPEYDWSTAVPVLISVLKDDTLDVRDNAAYALEKIGLDKIEKEEERLMVRVLPLLILGESNEIVRMGKPAVPPLIDALNDEDCDVRLAAAIALGEIGDTRAIPALINALKDEDKSVQENAVVALKEIAGKIADKEDHSSALKIIKDSTAAIMSFYSEKKDHTSLKIRRINLNRLIELTNKIHNQMNPDEKRFPVKRRGVRKPVRKQVIHSG